MLHCDWHATVGGSFRKKEEARARQQEAVDKARAKFAELDADDSGSLEGPELAQLGDWLWTSFHPGGQMISEEEAAAVGAKVLKRKDADGDGRMRPEPRNSAQLPAAAHRAPAARQQRSALTTARMPSKVQEDKM